MKPANLNHRHFHLLFLLGILFMLGCNKGCTTREVLGEETREIGYGDYKGTMRVRWIEIRHSRRKPGRGLLERKVSYNYALEYSLRLPKIGFQDLGELPYYDEDEEPNYEREFARFSMDFSPDYRHFAYGLEGSLKGLVHEFNGHLFKSNYDLAWKEKDLERINWSDLPTPRKLLEESLTAGMNCMSMDNETRLILSEMPIEDSIHMVALENWPRCQGMVDFYDEITVKRLAQNPMWKARAIVKAKEEMLEGFMDAEEGEQMLKYLGDRSVYDELDSVKVEKFGRGSFRSNEYVYKKLRSKTDTLSSKAQEMLLRRTDRVADQVLRRGSTEIELEDIFKVWRLMGESERTEKLLTRSFQKSQPWNRNWFWMKKGILDDYDSFSDSEQEIISAGVLKLFPKIKSYHRDDLFEAIQDFTDCEEQKRLMKKYPSDLEDFILPGRCE